MAQGWDRGVPVVRSRSEAVGETPRLPTGDRGQSGLPWPCSSTPLPACCPTQCNHGHSYLDKPTRAGAAAVKSWSPGPNGSWGARQGGWLQPTAPPPLLLLLARGPAWATRAPARCGSETQQPLARLMLPPTGHGTTRVTLPRGHPRVPPAGGCGGLSGEETAHTQLFLAEKPLCPGSTYQSPIICRAVGARVLPASLHPTPQPRHTTLGCAAKPWLAPEYHSPTSPSLHLSPRHCPPMSSSPQLSPKHRPHPLASGRAARLAGQCGHGHCWGMIHSSPQQMYGCLCRRQYLEPGDGGSHDTPVRRAMSRKHPNREHRWWRPSPVHPITLQPFLRGTLSVPRPVLGDIHRLCGAHTGAVGAGGKATPGSSVSSPQHEVCAEHT